MIHAYVGSGGKTTTLFKEKERLVKEGKKVLVCTSTHMKIEKDTCLDCDFETIVQTIHEYGYCMVGSRVDDMKMGPISYDLYLKLCDVVDEVLIEADGSRRLPLKVCRENEPVIYDNVECITLIGGCKALNQPLKDVCHRYELLNMEEDTVVSPSIFQQIIRKYKNRLVSLYPDLKVDIKICQTSSLYEQAFASLVEKDVDVECIDPSWFDINKHLFIFGAGHIGYALSKIASLAEFHVHVYDERKELTSLDRFKHVDEVICQPYEKMESYIMSNAYYAIMTPQHEKDYEVLRKLVHIPSSYLGMIGSKKKVAYELNRLKEEGISQEIIDTIHAPIGLKIHSQSPMEIAISIMAEIIQIKNSNVCASISNTLYESNEDGCLCILIKKEGSSPRNVGSMMLVTNDSTIDTIGGGKVEYLAIEQAKSISTICSKEYDVQEGELGICGGKVTVLFIPISKQNKISK